MSALPCKFVEQNHQHLQQPAATLQPFKISHKHNFNNLNNFNVNNNHINCNNNYATPTASSVLKQRKQTQNVTTTTTTTTAIISPSKYRKCPLSPLIITTNSSLILNTSLSSPSQKSVNMTMPSQAQSQCQPQLQSHQQHLSKLSPASPLLGLNLSPLSPNSSSICSSSVHLVRTTKTTRLRVAALDKKKDEEKLQQQRYTSPTSPKSLHYLQHNRRTSPSSNYLDTNPKLTEVENNQKMSPANTSPTQRGHKKLVPSVSVSVKQNLSETQCTASRSNSLRSPKSPKQKLQNTNAECSLKITASPKVKTKSNQMSFHQQAENIEDGIDVDFLEINDLPLNHLENNEMVAAIRPRCSTMYTDSDTSKTSFSNGAETNLDLSPVHKSRTCNRSPKRYEERDKSSKRKSNLNRSLNEEATPDGG